MKYVIAAVLLLTAAEPAHAQSFLKKLVKSTAATVIGGESRDGTVERVAETLIDLASSAKGSENSSPTASAGPGVPAGASSWQRYGIWSFKVDELAQGPDGHWQAIVSVRAETDHVGMRASEIDAFLIDADGQSIRDDGNLYDDKVTGTAAGLERDPGTNGMQRRDTARFRLLFPESKDLNPVTLRIRNSGADQVSNDYPMH
ncbi:hypothetical protein HNP52_003391 [Sphingomonas kyeonggiensis]|uniref:DUF4352 domain-containing protein n=1 Tax=Sphingomonas kyeonggiensis TaxID=1268553 RepID=A0A7W7K3B5_9SPHN|nr:hypothetical protein [Sphingomonas kyeonggiensis]MBB4840299.1 hypothetical protein [Sphingomonas kyeonggiensis]